MPDFNELDVDAIDGAETMSLLGLGIDDLQDPVNASKVKDVIDFFEKAIDKKAIINRVMKPGVEKIDHIWGYIQSRKEHQRLIREISSIKSDYENALSKLKIKEEELSHYENG